MSSAQGTSTSAVLSSLVANLILCGIFVGCFLVLRLKFKRIYAPKSSFDLVDEEKKPEPLPKDPVRWIFILLTKPHSFIIQQCGLDGYFFLRYLFIFCLTFTGGILIWTVLLPINAVHGKGNNGLDQLSISNVKHRKRYYAHAFISWFFYGTVIYIIYRELFFFNSFRAAVLSSPRYAKKLSSRTVLFQSVPDAWLDEKQFFKLFNGVKRIYISRNIRLLNHKVRQREDMAIKLEAATSKLLKTAMKAKIKADKKNITVENPENIDSWVPEKKRPRHKVNGFFSKKVDSINYYRQQLPLLDNDIYRLQKNYRKYRPKNSIFVEFENQYMAQLAYQSVVHHNPLRMSPVHTGVEPGDVDWDNMRLFWWERITRKAIAVASITAVVIFWAFPVAFVGVISNINYLTNKIHWLRWINDIPGWILGVITGLLPTVMLSLLMSILPMFIRGMAKVAGAISAQEVEMFTQSAYFAFLLVNGFLVTALASSATATVTRIIDNPSSALSILASSLPKACNFYISYLILQGLTVAGGALFQVVGLFLYYILGKLFDKTLRKKWARFSGLGTVAYGTAFPQFTILAIITLAFSIIAPMILLFAAVAFALIYIAYCHNLTYVFVEGPDSRGAHYPVALMQTFTGIYIGQICLLGLFVVGKGWGPIVVEAIGLGFTIFAHIQIKAAFNRLLTVVPIDAMKSLDGYSHTPSYDGESDYKTKVLAKHHKSYEEKKEENEVEHNLEENVENGQSLVPLMADRESKSVKADNFLIRWIRPDIFLNYSHAKQLIPATYNIEPEIQDNKHAYEQPFISAKMPTLWIPKDPMGWSTQEIKENSSFVTMSDENSGFTEKGNIVYLGKPPY
ncbi:hypothetical protein CLUG_05511 [Clavispora lusitaniae ATCC 42720]|uniref:DUF221-domain-containing protein n=1 Tax=Clavispora lusitaniae (strain ATCC 42720) TaxID=306902 RepID=C4YBD3_CLAL4|nr:uncharacterized protein CLUG_05511 [Clavispora lusitaniae ATCC 42720]EEQ41383.1 hypothetical protein CLUG_05511 [Clavispora lusitaniae ATCC 42720]KAF5208985.1 hypothetical protein E0198_004897 [Clavispora lusitaniae]